MPTTSTPRQGGQLIKFNTLLANLVVFHNALDISDIVRQLVAEGRRVTADQLGRIAPYLRAHISRFGAYATDELTSEIGAPRKWTQSSATPTSPPTSGSPTATGGGGPSASSA